MEKYLNSTNILYILALLLLHIHKIRSYATISKGNETEDNSRIVGGTLTTIAKAKYVVYLRVNGEFTCGGTLVTPKYVITAAHCVEGIKPTKVSIVGGATYLSDKGVKRNVLKMVIPKEYNSRTVHKDIAILELSTAITGKNISPITLCKSNLKTNDYINVYGWGRLSENNVTSSKQLRTVSVPLIEQQKCIDMYRGYGKITQSMFCAGDMKGKDACFGDSGGPAIFQNQLCGIVSWGKGCAQKKYPGVYTNIKSVRNFIDKNMI